MALTFCCRALSRDSTLICSLRSPACSAALSALAFVRTWAISSLALRWGTRGQWSRLGAAGHNVRARGVGSARLLLVWVLQRWFSPAENLGETGLIRPL